nr:hypothetical protein [Tanacetum cinerariifolium]
MGCSSPLYHSRQLKSGRDSLTSNAARVGRRIFMYKAVCTAGSSQKPSRRPSSQRLAVEAGETDEASIGYRPCAWCWPATWPPMALLTSANSFLK